jgi:hypothetical protein
MLDLLELVELVAPILVQDYWELGLMAKYFVGLMEGVQFALRPQGKLE